MSNLFKFEFIHFIGKIRCTIEKRYEYDNHNLQQRKEKINIYRQIWLIQESSEL